MTVRADSGFFSYDMIAAIGPAARTRTIRARQGQSSRGHRRRRWGDRVHPQRAQWLRRARPPRRQAARRRGRGSPSAATPSTRVSEPPARRPSGELWPQYWPYHSSSPTETTSTPKQPTSTSPPQSSCHQRPQRRLRGRIAAPHRPQGPSASGRLARRRRELVAIPGGGLKAHTSPCTARVVDPPRSRQLVAATHAQPLSSPSGPPRHNSGVHRLAFALNWTRPNTSTALTNRQPAPELI